MLFWKLFIQVAVIIFGSVVIGIFLSSLFGSKNNA